MTRDEQIKFMDETPQRLEAMMKRLLATPEVKAALREAHVRIRSAALTASKATGERS
jgi:hypothetical protein